MDFPLVKATVVLKDNDMTRLWKITIVLAVALPFLFSIPCFSAQTFKEKFQFEWLKLHSTILLNVSRNIKPYFQHVSRAVQILLKALPPEGILAVYWVR